MYSVEDLLVSHGYKLPNRTLASTPKPASSSSRAPMSSPPSYNKHHDVFENRPASREVKGYERESRGGGKMRHPHMYSGSCSINSSEPQGKRQSSQEGEIRSPLNTHYFGGSLNSEGRLCVGTIVQQPPSKDMYLWRRTGQDFAVLLDYADFKAARRGGQYTKSEEPQRATSQGVPTKEHQRIGQGKQCWATEAQTKACPREQSTVVSQWRMTNERKCQSLTADKHSFGHSLPQIEGEHWVKKQDRCYARSPECLVVHPRTKAKSQSLPRMLQPGNLQCMDRASSRQEVYRQVNGTPVSHHDLYRSPRWPEKVRSSSASQLSMAPKPCFTRPPRPPSYEMHQQIWGSCEVLSEKESFSPQARERLPLPLSAASYTQPEYHVQETGPPGYIPPPSYKKPPMMVVGCQGYGEMPLDYRYRGDVYQQIKVALDGSHWITRPREGSQAECKGERSTSSQKHLYSTYNHPEYPGRGIKYVPLNNPCIRHISSSLGCSSLTDADKICHICNELPIVTVSEPPSDNSAFLPPPLGPFVAAKLASDSNQMASSNLDSNAWHSNLHKAMDQNCRDYSKKVRRPPSPPLSYVAPLTRSEACKGNNSDNRYVESITQVKKIVPETGSEKRNAKKRVSETIFCLVSVPVQTPRNLNTDSVSDQNNNETIPCQTVTSTDTFAVGLKETHQPYSKLVNQVPKQSHYSHFHTGNSSFMKNLKRAPLRKEIIDAWALQVTENKKICYTGSWPGNQYRNQETQTGSPLTVLNNLEPESLHGGPKAVHSASVTTIDSGMGTDNSSSFSYPLAGQKNLHPSSNSAFSRLSISPTQLQILHPLEQDLNSPSIDQEQGRTHQSSPRKRQLIPQESSEQVAFGQFVLRQVDHQPCDAIGYIECVNKGMDDRISKGPKLVQCIDESDRINKKLGLHTTGTHLTAGPEPGRAEISLSHIHREEPDIIVRSKSFTSTDPDSMIMRIAFSRPQPNKKTSTREECLIPCPGCRHNRLLASLPPQSESIKGYKQDIPVPQESLLKDVGLTVYTEIPDGPREQVQWSHPVQFPLRQREFVQLSQENSTTDVCSCGESNLELQNEMKMLARNAIPGELGLSICGSNNINSQSYKSECPLVVKSLTKDNTFAYKDSDGILRYAISYPMTSKNISTIAGTHLKNFVSQAQGNALDVEELSNLQEVKCIDEIPENETDDVIWHNAVLIEAGKQPGDIRDDGYLTVAAKQQSQFKQTQKVRGEYVQVKVASAGAESEEVLETGIGFDHKVYERQKHSESHTDSHINDHTDSKLAVLLDLPEFPPSKLPLSLPSVSKEKPQLSICSGEKMGWGGVSNLVESLEKKKNSLASSSGTSLNSPSTIKIVQLTQLVSGSQIRCLCNKGCVSREEADEEDEDRENSKLKEGAKIELEEKQEDKMNLKKKVEQQEEPVYNPNNPDHVSHGYIPTVENWICKGDKRQEKADELSILVVLKARNEGSREDDIELDTEEPDGQAECLDTTEKNTENIKDVGRKGANREKLPYPKRANPQRPPLTDLCSVPKKELCL